MSLFLFQEGFFGLIFALDNGGLNTKILARLDINQLMGYLTKHLFVWLMK